MVAESRCCSCVYRAFVCRLLWKHYGKRSYLLNAISPALAYAISGPDVVCVLCQFVHHGLLGGRQFDVAQVQGSWLIAAGQFIAARKHSVQSTFFDLKIMII